MLGVDEAVVNVDAFANKFLGNDVGSGGENLDKLEEGLKLLEVLLDRFDKTEVFGLFDDKLIKFFESWHQEGRLIDEEITDEQRVLFGIGRLEDVLKEPCAQAIVIFEDGEQDFVDKGIFQIKEVGDGVKSFFALFEEEFLVCQLFPSLSELGTEKLDNVEGCSLRGSFELSDEFSIARHINTSD